MAWLLCIADLAVLKIN